MNERVTLFGCNMDNVSMEKTLEIVEGFVRSGRPHQHVVVNVDKLVKASRDEGLRRIINACDLVNVDGMPVVWAARLLGKPLKERVAGIDLFEALMRRAAERGWRVFLLGARAEVVQAVAATYAARYPGLVLAGVRDGYWHGGDEEAAIAPDSRQPRRPAVRGNLIAREGTVSGQVPGRDAGAVRDGGGGSFDVAAGRVKRAPAWMQRSGLEWFHRFLQEPRRMFRRYFIDDMVFLWLLVKEAARDR